MTPAQRLRSTDLGISSSPTSWHLKFPNTAYVRLIINATSPSTTSPPEAVPLERPVETRPRPTGTRSRRPHCRRRPSCQGRGKAVPPWLWRQPGSDGLSGRPLLPVFLFLPLSCGLVRQLAGRRRASGALPRGEVFDPPPETVGALLARALVVIAGHVTCAPSASASGQRHRRPLPRRSPRPVRLLPRQP